MTTTPKIPTPMSVDEFLVWEPGDDRRWQLVDGVPHAMALTNITHGIVMAHLGALIGNHLHARTDNCAAIMFPCVVPHVNACTNVRIPDLAVTCALPTEEEEMTLADPVLIAEIISPDSQAETWANVWTYTTIPSVREILVLTTAAIGAEIWRRRADGSWPRNPERLVEGEIMLTSIGLHMLMADVYAKTLLMR